MRPVSKYIAEYLSGLICATGYLSEINILSSYVSTSLSIALHVLSFSCTVVLLNSGD